MGTFQRSGSPAFWRKAGRVMLVVGILVMVVVTDSLEENRASVLVFGAMSAFVAVSALVAFSRGVCEWLAVGHF